MKKGITLLEILIVTLIFSLIILVCVPEFNDQAKKYIQINNNQISYHDQLIFYDKIKSILSTLNEINYEINGEKLIISMNNHNLVCNENNELILDDVFYNVVVLNKEIKQEYILFNVLINGKEQCIVLRGTINEVYRN